MRRDPPARFPKGFAMRLFAAPLALLLLFAPVAAQEEFSAPTRESYDLERLAKTADLVLLVDVTRIDAERKGRMITGGPGSVVDFHATVREILKGDLATPDVVVRAVGHKFFQSGRLLMGPALFYAKRPSGEQAGRPLLELSDPFGKFFLKAKDEPEIKDLLDRAGRAVDLTEPVREGTPVSPAGRMRPPATREAAAPPGEEEEEELAIEPDPVPAGAVPPAAPPAPAKPIPVPILEEEAPAESPGSAAPATPTIESVIKNK